MLYFLYVLDIVLLFAVPISLGIFLVRKFDLEGRWWWIGAVVYAISQIIFVPLQNYGINPFLNRLSLSGKLPSLGVLILGGLTLGLILSIIEELLRYGMLRWWAKDARSFKSALLLGTGQAGAGAIFLGFLVLYNFIYMAMIRRSDLSTLPSTDQLKFLQSQIAAFWSAPWYYTIREALGQIYLLPIQVCLAVMMLQVFIRKQSFWLFLAIGFHTLVETVRIITLNLSNENLANIVLFCFAVLSFLIILALRPARDTMGKS
jgi:uncharacterized membrane protein YhfC